MYYISDFDYTGLDYAEFGIKQLLKNLKNNDNIVSQQVSDKVFAQNIADGNIPNRQQLREIGESFKNPIKGFQRGLRRDRLAFKRLRQKNNKLTKKDVVNDSIEKGKKYLRSRPEWVNTLETKVPSGAAGFLATSELGVPWQGGFIVSAASSLPARQISRDVSATLKELDKIPKGSERRLSKALKNAKEARMSDLDTQIRDFYGDVGGTAIGKFTPKSTPVRLPKLHNLATGAPSSIAVTPKLKDTMSSYHAGKISASEIPKEFINSWKKPKPPKPKNNYSQKFKDYLNSYKQNE
jgi:hypothetical protein